MKLKLWEIEYTFEYIKEVSKENIDDEFNDVKTEENNISYITTKLHLGASDITDAMIMALEICDKNMDEHNIKYEINAVREVFGVDILNWPGEGEPCNCPYCRAERMADEDLMHFECFSCKTELKVSDGGWESILCTACGEEIFRDGLLDIGNGRFKTIKVSNKEE